MKQNEIKVGAEYAYQENTYSSVHHVRVVKQTVIPQGRYNKLVTGWTIEMADGTGFWAGPNQPRPDQIDVHGRTILADWAPYHENQKRKAAAKRESNAKREQAAVAAWQDLALVDRALGFLFPSREQAWKRIDIGDAEHAKMAGWDVRVTSEPYPTAEIAIRIQYKAFRVKPEDIPLSEVALLADAVVGE